MAATAQDLKIYRYPLKRIDKSQDYLKIECLEYIPPGLNIPVSAETFTFRQASSDEQNYPSSGSKNILGTILLPIPNNLPENSNAVMWGESKMGPGQTLAIGAAMGFVQGGPEGFANSLVAAALGIKDAAKTSTGQKALQSYFAAKGAEQLLGQDNLFSDVLARRTGAVFNENVELLFRGLTLRESFSFSFDISPRDKDESNVVKQMVRFLKQQMAAKKGKETGAANGLFLKTPSVFRIQYMSGGKPHPYLNTFKICALQSISLNFNGSNEYATYSDGTPVHMQLGLSFRELTPIYDTDYDKGAGKDGVGY